MTDKLKRVLRYLLSLGLMGGLLYWAFRDAHLRDVGSRIVTLPLPWAAAIVVTALFTLVMRGWRWAVLMRPFAPQVTVLDTTLALGICYTANVPVPRSGEFVRALSLRWVRGIRVTSTLATVVVERILDVVGLVVFLGVAVLLVRGRLQDLIPGIRVLSLLLFLASVVTLGLLGLVSLYQDRALSWLQPRLARVSPRIASRAIELLRTFIHGLQALHRPGAYLEIVLSTIMLQLGYLGIIWAAFYGFGFVEQYGLGPRESLVIWVFSSLGATIPTPGAAGSYHAFFAKPLVHWYAVEPSAALACATAVHALTMVTYAAIGLPAFVLQRRAARRHRSEGVSAGCEIAPR